MMLKLAKQRLVGVRLADVFSKPAPPITPAQAQKDPTKQGQKLLKGAKGKGKDK